jgi:O-succinylbenzoate synthase
MAHAALAQATADLAAKTASLPLWRYLGGQDEVWASAAIGLDDAGRPGLKSLRRASAQGYRHAKLKITPHTDPAILQEARDLYPDMGLGLDGNASLSHDDMELLTAVDAMGFAYIEQPGASTDLGWHALLRRQMTTPVALDEAAATDSAIARILETAAADIVNLKVGRFGPWQTLTLARQVVAAGRKVRLGGLIESGIGRAHTVALATCSEFSVTGDIAASDRYFDDDLITPPWRLESGRLPLPTEPGIGVVVNETAIDRYAYDSFSIG